MDRWYTGSERLGDHSRGEDGTGAANAADAGTAISAPAASGGTTFPQANIANEVMKAQERKLRLSRRGSSWSARPKAFR